MRSFTKAFLMLLLCTLSVLTTQAKTEKVHATFENPSNTNTTWNAETKTFTWSTTYYNQLRNIGLPNGDITKYKKLVVDCTIKSGDQFRVLIYKGGSNKTLYASNGVNEFILADTLKALYPDDYNEFLLGCDEICLSGNNNAAPGEAVINDIYLETYDDEGEKVYATFENPSNTNTTWNSETKTFTWSTTYYNQLRNIGLPNGDITKYKKLVVDCTIKSGDQFRVLIYKGGSNKTLYASNGVNEFILADTLKALYPDDYNEFLKACDEICLSGNNNAAPGEAVINAVYLETYPENESVEIPDIVYEEDPGKPEGNFVDFIEVFSTLQPRIGLGEDTHPIVLGNGDVVVGQRTKDVIADLSAYSKLTMVTSPNLKLVVYMNHEVDAQQNAGDYAPADSGKYVFLNVQADENGIAEIDLTQYTKQNLNCICLPWDNNNKGTVWYLLLTKKADTPAATEATFDFNASDHAVSASGETAGDITANEVNTVNDVVMTISPAASGTANRYWGTNNGPQLRMYSGTMTLEAPEGKAITKVVINNGKWNADNTFNGVAAQKGEWEGNSTNVVLAIAGNTQMNSVVVTLADKNAETTTYETEPAPEPVHIANTAETAYTVAKAIELINAGEALSDTVFVKGIVSQVDKFDETDKYITYWISDDGTTTNQFECYHGKGIAGADFASIDDVKVGAEVIAKGIMKKFINKGDTIYEFDKNNELVSYKAPFKPLFADGKYYIYNVGTQKYLAAGANWGTHAAVNATGLDYEIKAADGKYTLDSQVSNGGANHFLNGEWNDGAAFGWTIAKVSDGIFTISNGEKFLTAGENGVVTLADDATAEAAQWSMKTLEARIAELATATAEAPIDATFLIQDANFGRNDLRKSAWKMEASNQNLSGGEDNNGTVGNNCAESYHSVFTLSQTLSNAPAGKYKMTAQGFYRQDGSDNENLPVFYANDKTGTFPLKTGSENNMTDASKSFSAGSYTIEPIEVTVFEDGQLTVGAKLATNTSLWCIFDNFRLTYLGNAIDLTEIIAGYNKALEDAKAALAAEENAIVTGEERTALTAAIAANENVAQNQDSLTAAFTALNNATSAFTGAKGAYNALATAKTEKAAMTFAYAAADKKAAAEATLTAEATSAADATAKVEAITKAYRVYAESSALLEGVEGAQNMTDAILNPQAENEVNNWTTVLGEGSGGSIGIRDNEPWTDGADNATHKYFDGGNWGAQAWDVTLEQKIALPAGKYQLTVKGRAAADVAFTLFASEDSTTMPAIGASGGLFNSGWNDASVEFAMTKTDSITIGVRGVTQKQYNWMSFSDFRLVKFPATAEEIALYNAIDALMAIINADKTIVTEGQKGAEELANAIATAETAANAKNATVESIAAARAALASAVATFTKANMGKDFVEIEQTQSPEISDGASRATAVEGDGYTQYTTDGGVCVIIKKYDIDVKDCDYVTIKFAEPLPNGINAAFWAQSGTDNVGMPAGTYEYKYVFADDAKCAIANDILPQLTLLTLWNSQTVSIAGVYKHKIPVTHTWDFTQWSEETVTNLKAEAAKGTSEGLWSDQEKADSSAVTKLISIENCYWQVGTSAAEGEELTANGQPIAELQGLLFKNNKARSLAIAVNYGDCSSANGADFGPYNGPSYLWLGSKGVEYFTIKNVKAGTEIKMGIESHKITDARGVQLLIDGTAIQGPDAPTTYTEQTWQIPTGEGVVDVVVKNTNGCHIYFIDAEIGEAPLETHTFEGYVAIATTLQGDIQGEVTTAAQTVTLAETETDNVVAVTFSGFSSTIPPVNFSEFTFNATIDADETLTTELYEVAANSKVTGTNGTMTLDYTITGNGSATADSIPTFALKLNQNPMMTINVVFAATAEEAKAALLSTTGIINIARDAQKNIIYNLNGQKVNKAQKGLYIINGKKVFK